MEGHTDIIPRSVSVAKAQVPSGQVYLESVFSTINCTFLRGDKANVKGGSSNWSGNAMRDAKDNLSGIGQLLGTMGIYGLVFFPIWLPLAIAAYVIRKKTR